MVASRSPSSVHLCCISHVHSDEKTIHWTHFLFCFGHFWRSIICCTHGRWTLSFTVLIFGPQYSGFRKVFTSIEIAVQFDAILAVFLDPRMASISDCCHLIREVELSHVRRQLNRLQHWVVSPADHFPHSLTAHCLVSKTFLDEDVFLRCSQPAQQVLRNLELQVPHWIQQP